MTAETPRGRKQRQAREIANTPTATEALGFCTDCGASCTGRVVGSVEQNVACASVVICGPCDKALKARHQRWAREDRDLINAARAARRRTTA
ncbi:hypothetical protein GXW83_27415 [Streptacidiphilus sp. PB12-B1b]|uniref:hypothetical protein n=1 Tax=Streptacidiphilus sp. PB12-B1b TaxID=2705012 RepID=UPI0015F92C5A|nr:hypothetical protein [Streptacidiphilus sp. PB12-B1b]QMU78875.1 hypothetical protein GXW83_27415 [Streptacidiphilus sp. PB12-B1b]